MRPAWFVLAVATLLAGSRGFAQSPDDFVQHGEQVFNRSSATGYCHGIKGTAAGAPRLAARGFAQAYIDNPVARTWVCTHQSLFQLTPRIRACCKGL
jgi:hypothetical protein